MRKELSTEQADLLSSFENEIFKDGFSLFNYAQKVAKRRHLELKAAFPNESFVFKPPVKFEWEWSVGSWEEIALVVENSTPEIMSRLLDLGMPLSSTSADGDSLLVRALESGNHPVALLLLERGAWAVERKDDVVGLMHRAAYKNSPFAVFEKLVEVGVPINDRDIKNMSPLMVSICEGNKDAFESLICFGANIHERVYEGNLLQWLAEENNIKASPGDMVHFASRLRNLGVASDTTFVNEELPPFMRAIRRGRPFLLEELAFDGCCDRLHLGFGALHMCLSSRQFECVEFALSKGASWTLPDDSGQVPSEEFPEEYLEYVSWKEARSLKGKYGENASLKRKSEVGL